jgi:hypothetical protein
VVLAHISRRPIQEEEAVQNYQTSSHSSKPTSISAIPQTPPIPGTASSDALLIQEDAGDYPWFQTNNPASRSSDSFHVYTVQNPGKPSWPAGVKSGLFLVAFILILNAAVTLWASMSFSVEGGLGTIYRGTCAQVESTGFSLHILINIIGTLLLGASNYCMQCLTSPTRKEIDREHREKRWLEIGLLSLRNLRVINTERIWLWFFLGLSSFPIHLMSVLKPRISSQYDADLQPGTTRPSSSHSRMYHGGIYIWSAV